MSDEIQEIIIKEGFLTMEQLRNELKKEEISLKSLRMVLLRQFVVEIPLRSDRFGLEPKFKNVVKVFNLGDLARATLQLEMKKTERVYQAYIIN